MNIQEKWINEYINNIDITKIQWIKFNMNELINFYEENYFDKDVLKYVRSESDDTFVTPIGLHYLNFEQNNDNYSFLLGVVDNNINKKTIVAAMIYLENYYVFREQQVPLTYISTVETNLYFRNKGIYIKLCKEVINFLNPNQHILISRESNLGSKCGVVNILKKVLMQNGFKNKILIDDLSNYMNKQFYEIFNDNEKVLKKYKV